MKRQMSNILSVILAGIWVNASEFLRNQILFNGYWVGHYKSLGMTFPSEPVNGMLWGVWGFLFALAVFLLSRRFDLVQTTLLSWLMGFVLMWLVIYNLSVLPVALLLYAVPLSMLEAFVAAFICLKTAPSSGAGQ